MDELKQGLDDSGEELAISIPDGAKFIEPGMLSKRLSEAKFYSLSREHMDAIAVRKLPAGLKLWLEEFQESQGFSSLAQLEIVATAYGMLTLLKDKRVKKLVNLYRIVSKKAREECDREAAQVLERKSDKFTFEKETPYTGSIKALKEIEGMMGKLSSAINLDQGKTYTYCMLISLQAQGNLKFNRMFDGEMKRFWEYVKDWTALLDSRVNRHNEDEQ